jgi:RNA-directed DNA polymerase
MVSDHQDSSEQPSLALSPSSLSRAFARVRENHGCAGCDGISIAEFQGDLDTRLGGIRAGVEDESYFAWPLRRIEIEKRPGSPDRRTLLVPAVADRVLQTAVAAFLEPILEPEFEECSFAYRRGRSVRMAVERVHSLFQQGYRWVLDADIDAFFDSVDKEVVLSQLAPLVHDETVLRLTRLWLDYAVWDGLHLSRPALGLPQGAVVSPLLANLCLDSFDERLLQAGLKLVRYSDDFVVLAKSRNAVQDALELTEAALAQLRLRLKEDKTRLVRASEGFRFLGVIFLKDLLVQPLRGGRKRLKALSVAPPIPESFFPAGERRPLRHYRSY